MEVVPMYRPHRWSALACVFLVPLLSTLRAGAPPAEETWHFDKAVTVSPRAEPMPAFKYRLFPLASERKEGNAVPMYLRFAHFRTDAAKKDLHDKPQEWNKLPLKEIPLAEAGKFLAEHAYNRQQLELGARRKTAEWNYAFDIGSIVDIRLPDAQEMRLQAPLLVLEARVAMAERRWADAVHTLETGFSFSQQVGGGPFYINGLVGIAIANQFLDCVLEAVEQPDAPNLYWALTALPRPLIDLRTQSEQEQRTATEQYPDLADIDRPRSPEEWEAALGRVRKEMDRLRQIDREMKKSPPPAGMRVGDPASKSPDLPAAKKYLVEVVGKQAAAVEAMPPAQVLLLYLLNSYKQSRDDFFKAAYLPFPQGRVVAAEAERRLKAAGEAEPARFARLWNPAIPKVLLNQVRIDRKAAALRVIEALRMHAAANGGKLPDTLADVKGVPVPEDPGTGQPFEYRRDGDTATLISRIPGEQVERTGLRYRITVRK
jgi:hypothetical protein